MNAALMTEPAHWAMGSDLGALAAIFEKAVSLAVMQRRLGPALRSSVLAQGGSGGWQAAWLGIPGETLASELAAQLPAPGQAGPLVADVQLLAEATACLFGVVRVAVRLRMLEKAMCPRFHCDNLPVRLVTTYLGPGSEWLPDSAVERGGLGVPDLGKPDPVREPGAIRQLGCGDVALLKGSGWVGNEERGIVHRSPALKDGQQRLLLTLDPCF